MSAGLDLSATLAAALGDVDRSAGAIEQVFLRAGERLSLGLDAFGAMGDDLARFLAEIRDGAMAGISGTLSALSGRLVEISEAMPRDAATLQALLAENERVARSVTLLLDAIRTMTVVVRSARIEAAALAESGEFQTFTADMSALAQTVEREIVGCAERHEALTLRMRKLAVSQAALDRDVRAPLLRQARELSDLYRLVEERQAHSLAMIEGVAERSRGILAEATGVLVALQAGDATRQRLEHVSGALRHAATLGTGASPADVEIPSALRLPAAAALGRLGAAQLHDLVADFGTDAAEIDALLRNLGQALGDLVVRGEALYGGDGIDGFLATFRARLDAAAGIIRTCGSSRRDVRQATTELRASFSVLSRSISALTATAFDLIIVVVNAGLRSSRLGTRGRSLVVIADELKRLAEVMRERSPLLLEEVRRVEDASRALSDDDEGETLADPDAAIAAIVAAIGDSSRRVAAFFETLGGKGRGFEGELAETRGGLAGALADCDLLLDLADRLAEAGAAEPAWQSAAPYATSLVGRHYTMARERDIHAAVLGPVDAAPAAIADAA